MTITAYWVLGIPLAWFFGIHKKDMGVKGVWIGPTAACTYLSLMYNVLIMCINWPALFAELKERRETEDNLRAQLQLQL